VFVFVFELWLMMMFCCCCCVVFGNRGETPFVWFQKGWGKGFVSHCMQGTLCGFSGLNYSWTGSYRTFMVIYEV